MGSMDKFIYRGTLIVLCLILTIVLVISPVMIMMWIKIQKAEIRIERKEKQLDRKIQLLQQKDKE
jgi:flagellar basal body-associated protein FliL